MADTPETKVVESPSPGPASETPEKAEKTPEALEQPVEEKEPKVEEVVEKPSEEAEVIPVVEEEAEMPEGLSEKAQERFQKLAKENKEFKQEKQKRETSESAFDTIKKGANPTYEDYLKAGGDPNIYSEAEFNQAVQDPNYRASLTERKLEGLAFQMEVNEAARKHPRLDKDSENYSLDFEQRVAEKWSFVNQTGGKKISIREAAEIVATEEAKLTEGAMAKGAAEASEELQKKTEAVTEVPGKTGGERKPDRTAELRENAWKSQKPEDWAKLFAERGLVPEEYRRET